MRVNTYHMHTQHTFDSFTHQTNRKKKKQKYNNLELADVVFVQPFIFLIINRTCLNIP